MGVLLPETEEGKGARPGGKKSLSFLMTNHCPKESLFKFPVS